MSRSPYSVGDILDPARSPTLADVLVLYQHLLPIPRVSRGRVALDIPAKVRSLASLQLGSPRDIASQKTYEFLAPARANVLAIRQVSQRTRMQLVELLNTAANTQQPLQGEEGLIYFHHDFLLRATAIILDDTENYGADRRGYQFQWKDDATNLAIPCLELWVDRWNAPTTPPSIVGVSGVGDPSNVLMTWNSKPPASLDSNTMALMSTLAHEGMFVTSGFDFKILCGDNSSEAGMASSRALEFMLHLWTDLRSRQVTTSFLANDQEVMIYRVGEGAISTSDNHLPIHFPERVVTAHLNRTSVVSAGDTVLGAIMGFALEMSKPPPGLDRPDREIDREATRHLVPDLPVDEYSALAIYWPKRVDRWHALHSIVHVDELRPFFGPVPVVRDDKGLWAPPTRLACPIMLDKWLGDDDIWDVFAARQLGPDMPALLVKFTNPDCRPLSDQDKWTPDDVHDAVTRECFVLQYIFSQPKMSQSVPRFFGRFSGVHPTHQGFGTAQIVAIVIEDSGPVVEPKSLNQVDIDNIIATYRQLHAVGIIHGSPRPKHWRRRRTDRIIQIVDFTNAQLRPSVLGRSAYDASHPWTSWMAQDFERGAAAEMEAVMRELGVQGRVGGGSQAGAGPNPPANGGRRSTGAGGRDARSGQGQYPGDPRRASWQTGAAAGARGVPPGGYPAYPQAPGAHGPGAYGGPGAFGAQPWPPPQPGGARYGRPMSMYGAAPGAYGAGPGPHGNGVPYAGAPYAAGATGVPPPPGTMFNGPYNPQPAYGPPPGFAQGPNGQWQQQQMAGASRAGSMAPQGERGHARRDSTTGEAGGQARPGVRYAGAPGAANAADKSRGTHLASGWEDDGALLDTPVGAFGHLNLND